MKTRVSISFGAENLPGEADAILIPTGCGPDVAKVLAGSIYNIREVSVYIRLDETDERVPKVFGLLKQYGVEFKSFTFIEYSDEDLQNARLLWMSPAANVDVFAGFQYGTEYDLTNACANCKTGGKQTSVLYVDNDDIATIRKHRAVQTYSDEILVDAGMRKKLVDARCTGISFGSVRARHNNGKWTEVARDQILIEHVMPPMRGELPIEGDKYLCKICHRGGRMAWPDKFYREEDLVGMCDFNLTWEWFGIFGPADDKHRERRSSPRVLVTPKVMNIFREAGVKTLDWRPVGVEE